MKEVKKNRIKSRNTNVSSHKRNISTKIENKKKQTPKKVKGPNLKELEYEIRKDIRKQRHNRKNIYILIVVLIVLIIFFIALHIIIPKIDLKGLKELEIAYDNTYVEEGATASYFNKDLTNKIKITSNIDTKKVGTYEVIYTVEYNFYKVQEKRIVRVVDKKKPIINLIGEKEVDVCPTKKFKELGYTATDEYDGDITDKVKINQQKDKVIYSVKDSSGNSYSITRKITEIDKTNPIITLKGNVTMYLGLEEDFKEPGYSATDNCSGDLSDRVIVTGKVKSKQKGTYTLTYEVSDDQNNKTIIERKVIISEKTDPNSGIIKKGTIYLTFDDGPSSIITGSILDILKEEGIKATFFVTNNGPDYLIKRIYDEGHTIALHTASHNYSNIYSSVDNYFNDLKIVSDRVERITGQTSKIVRFPGGSSNTVSRRYSQGIMSKLTQELFNRGYRYYDWNIDSRDASNAKTKEDVYNNIINNLSKNKANIVLMHDIKIPTRDALRAIINYGKENGYTFDRIDMDTYMIRQNIRN